MNILLQPNNVLYRPSQHSGQSTGKREMETESVIDRDVEVAVKGS